ncbi:YjdJ family protein [Rossellomorea sp. SC111]|uniref:YjdJ family protein n=1 Tax=Rossellomorea sp. SC111 TaxID=2968985 RepID=UPI00215A3700|nr:YjdJ family protein [Rossellomorea sp. SC111]MCR8847419.1 YjdJ family protein [Rossellomorea sp. SC111]
MSIKYWSQVGIGMLVLGFSTLVSWYEGSALLDHSWEWRYSAPLSEMVHGSVTNSNDIVTLDFFVYAAKFSPLYPGMMIISASYLLILFGFRVFKQAGFRICLALMGMIYLALSFIISSSPTTGGNALFWLLLSAGALMIVAASLIHVVPFLRLRRPFNQN